MKQYLTLCKDILERGERTHTRTGIDTIGVFGAMMQFDLREGFPILTTKKVLFPTVIDELLWFIRGGHNVKDADAPKRIWDDWADEHGELGRIYGVQWRDWQSVVVYPEGEALYTRKHYDQLQQAIERVKKTPNNRRNLVSAWNVGELEQGLIGFPPCHVMFQLRVMGEGEQKRLDLAMYQRSCDMALGVPFNISSYALLLTLIAHECKLIPGVFTHFLADAHVYVNHIDPLKRQLDREPYPLPRLKIIDPVLDCYLPKGFPVIEITKENLFLENYKHYPFIKFEIAV